MKGITKKTCAICEKWFEQKRKEKYCSDSCRYKGKLFRHSIYRSKEGSKLIVARINAKRNYGILSNEFDKYIQNGCQECGFKEFVLDFHHIDKNHKNHSKENLRYLCPNCHARYHRTKTEMKPVLYDLEDVCLKKEQQ